ncbi:MAG: hypothetical protein ACYDEI_00075 [Erysipelotrichaceae bacterium]
MDIRKILDKSFKGKEVKIKDLKDVKELNSTFLKTIENEALKHYSEKKSINYNVINEFCEGNQWKSDQVVYNTLSFNNAGKVVYNQSASFNENKEKTPQGIVKPQLQINLIKSKLETLVALFAQVDPVPMAESGSDYNKNEELINRINLCLNQIFVTENNFDELYEVNSYNALKYGEAYYLPYIDIDHSETSTPIKIKVINNSDKDNPIILTDPMYDDINQSDYLRYTLKMRYWDIKNSYDYLHEGLEIEEPKDEEIVDLYQWWFRTKDSENKTKWLKFLVFKGKWIRPINEKGNVDWDETLIEMTNDYLPFVQVKAKNDGTSLVTALISEQIAYNRAISEEEWNFIMTINPPIVSSASDSDSVTKGLIPNGKINLQNGEQVQYLNRAAVSQSEFSMHKQSIKQDMDEITGQIDTIAGVKPTGTYSGTLMETIQKSSEIKPRMIESHLLTKINELAEKCLYILQKFIPTSGISIWDADKQANETIKKEDIADARYKLTIDTKDANLLTRDMKFQVFEKYMQYTTADPMFRYLMAEMMNTSIPHLFPKNFIDELKKQAETPKASESVPPNYIEPSGGQIPVEQNSNIPQSTNEQSPEGDLQDIDGETLLQKIEEYKQQLFDLGMSEKDIANAVQTIALDNYQKIPNSDIVSQFEEFVNKQYTGKGE